MTGWKILMIYFLYVQTFSHGQLVMLILLNVQNILVLPKHLPHTIFLLPPNQQGQFKEGGRMVGTIQFRTVSKPPGEFSNRLDKVFQDKIQTKKQDRLRFAQVWRGVQFVVRNTQRLTAISKKQLLSLLVELAFVTTQQRSIACWVIFIYRETNICIKSVETMCTCANKSSIAKREF